jgi:glycosyltransferase involved in cell wall biosynthesis
MQKISACVMTKNNEATIVRCLESLQGFDEILVLDTGSEDGTLEAVSSFPTVRLLRQGPIKNFGKTRNYLASQAKNDWILMVDSDEFASPELVEEILNADLDASMVYELSIINHFLGRPIRGCGWHPCHRRRLYHRRHSRWKEMLVHESLEMPENVSPRRLRGELHHLAYRGYPAFLAKFDKYTSLWAEERRGKRVSWLTAVLHGLWMFARSYFFKRGIFYGYAGFHISFFYAFGSLLKRMKLYELNHGVLDSTSFSPRERTVSGSQQEEECDRRIHLKITDLQGWQEARDKRSESLRPCDPR